MNWEKDFVNATEPYWRLVVRPGHVDPVTRDYVMPRCIFISQKPQGYVVFRAIPEREDVGTYETLAAAKEAGEINAVEWELEGFDAQPSEVREPPQRGVLWRRSGLRGDHRRGAHHVQGSCSKSEGA